MGNTESKPSDGGLIREGDSNRGAEGNRSYGYFNVIRNLSENYRLRTEIRESTDKIVSLNNKTHELEEWFNRKFDHARGLQMQADDLLEQR